MTCNLLLQLCIETLQKSRMNKYSTGWQQCAEFGVSLQRSCELFLAPNGWALSVFCSSRFLFMIIRYRAFARALHKLSHIHIYNTDPTQLPEYFSNRTTGSTIRNCDKVNTWLDQMLWQIYQKLMLSGFLSNGNLCLIHHLKLFWPHTALAACNKKDAISYW